MGVLDASDSRKINLRSAGPPDTDGSLDPSTHIIYLQLSKKVWLRDFRHTDFEKKTGGVE